MFQIAPLNPLRFLDPAASNKFDRLSSLEQINIYQEKRCYFQKWNLDDATRLQVLSDFEFTFDICSIYTPGVSVLNVVPIEIPTTIIGQTFKVYEVPIDFSLLGEGDYYGVITYTNELVQEIELLSEPFEVWPENEETILFTYKNSDNNFSVIFGTDIEFDFRVEGLIANFNPVSDDLIYNDQKRNATLLDSIPYRTFTLFVAGPAGIPEWVADKVNRIMACNMVAIDGDYYEKTEGASWETVRADEYPFVGLQTEIMPVENRFLGRFINGNDPGSVLIVDKTLEYSDISGDFAITGKFDDRSLLEKIVIYRSGATFILNVGLTPGGSEIGEFEVVDNVLTQTINYAFETDVTLYLSGITSADAIYILYKQLDENPIPTGIGGGGGTSVPDVGIGATLIYSFTDPNVLDANFDMVSGLGREETDWEGWAVADGRNGTVDLSGFLPMGYSALSSDAINDEVGSNEATIGNNNLPEHKHFTAKAGSAPAANLSNENTLASTRSGAGDAGYNFGGLLANADVGLTSKAGNEIPDPLNITPKSKIVLFVTKVA